LARESCVRAVRHDVRVNHGSDYSAHRLVLSVVHSGRIYLGTFGCWPCDLCVASLGLVVSGLMLEVYAVYRGNGCVQTCTGKICRLLLIINYYMHIHNIVLLHGHKHNLPVTSNEISTVVSIPIMMLWDETLRNLAIGKSILEEFAASICSVR
jgi:hypothetical protein